MSNITAWLDDDLEIDEKLLSTETVTEDSVENVVIEIGAKILSLDNQLAHIKDRKSDLQRQERVISSEIEKLTKKAMNFMIESQQHEILNEKASVRIKTCPLSVKDANMDQITKAYTVVRKTPDKRKALAAFKKTGKEPKGFTFTRNTKLEVK